MWQSELTAAVWSACSVRKDSGVLGRIRRWLGDRDRVKLTVGVQFCLAPLSDGGHGECDWQGESCVVSTENLFERESVGERTC